MESNGVREDMGSTSASGLFLFLNDSKQVVHTHVRSSFQFSIRPFFQSESYHENAMKLCLCLSVTKQYVYNYEYLGY